MTYLAIVVVALGIAYLASALTVPMLVRVAANRQLFDFPDRVRHGHALPVPRLGGVAVFSGLAAALVVAKLIGLFAYDRMPPITQLTIALGAGSVILFILGLYDDVRGVPPIAKLTAQAIAAILVIQAGFRIDVITFPPNLHFSLGSWAIPVTVLWLVGVSNALNLVDGMDGLAGGVSIIALCVTTGAAMVLGNFDVTWQTFALIGAVLGFLRYNAPPARIFLGDSGSLVVGFLLAVLSVKGATQREGALFALAPIFALSYPLLDTGIAILRRFLRREPLSRADGRHIHHQLRAIGLGPRRSVAVILLQSSVVGLLGLCVTFAPPELTVAVAAAGGALLVFVFVYGLKWLQYHEFVEVGMSFTSAVMNARVVLRDKILARDVALLVDRAHDLHELSSILRKNAGAFRFTDLEVCFETDPIPALSALTTPARNHWRLEYPIAPIRTVHGTNGGGYAYLVISCPIEANQRTANPERVARILAPALARWMESRGMEEERILRMPPVVAPPRSRRDSGGWQSTGSRERARV